MQNNQGAPGGNSGDEYYQPTVHAQIPADPQPSNPQPSNPGAGTQNPYGAQAPYNPYGQQAPQNPPGQSTPQYPYGAGQYPYGQQAPQNPYAAHQHPYGAAPEQYGYGPQYAYGAQPPSGGNGNGKVIGIVVGVIAVVAIAVAAAVLLTGDDETKNDDQARGSASSARAASSTYSYPSSSYSPPSTASNADARWNGTFVGTVPTGDTHTFTFTQNDPIAGQLLIVGANGGMCQLAVTQNSRQSPDRASLHMRILDSNGCRDADGNATLSGNTLTIEYSDYTFDLRRQ